MPSWNSRLVVKYDTGSGEKTITPIESFQPSFAMNAEPLHSVEAINIGVIAMPEQINFTITVKALGTATAELTKLALDRTAFRVVMEEVDDGSDPEWSLTEVLLDNCFITNATPSSAAISGAPTATFSGFALGGEAKSASQDAAAVGAPIES
ncbi:hypothetical protein C882_1770 [Caenispirillum salinarum AK4]|uniref:Uncharacterized protein n=1 Tax=Caenispirillum salinarum AK4 TaxID=1238182 RepID=K9H9H9_9PROT|nr:hypothetical protein [Caenispirillum salinarum]EKV27268.1 hypothetical protein C882_1770 [Caenispirillum salinarum AK4]